MPNIASWQERRRRAGRLLRHHRLLHPDEQTVDPAQTPTDAKAAVGCACGS
ncbi:hypothetical protein [Streptomyces sp. NPDC127112]|uniref:hypothetical protein n=1 Tax=Streptomyces sp. NPDC127112 TaxID=3345364 RepID=UPI00363F3734